MSNELDKLAAEMRKLKSSKDARARAVEAAMSAFSDEFLPETAAAKVNAKSEKKLEASQGLTAEPRPTGQKARGRRVQTFGRQTMKKFNDLINFKPQTMMMAGSCAAALLAGLIILPNMGELGLTDGAAKTASSIEASVESGVVSPENNANGSSEVSADLKSSPAEVTLPKDIGEIPKQNIEVLREKTPEVSETVDEIVVTARRANERPEAPNPEPEPIPEPEAQQEIIVTGTRQIQQDAIKIKRQSTVVVDALSAEEIGNLPALSMVEALETIPEVSESAKLQGGIGPVSSLLNDIRQDAATTSSENRQRVQQFRQPQSQQGVSPSFQPGYVAPDPRSQIQTRRTRTVIPGSANAPALPEKIAGLTVDAGEPEFQTVTQTIVVQEASSEIVRIPPSFETVTETVVVKPASVEYIVEPTEYEWVDGDVEGSSVEYQTIPAEFETVSETVVVQEASTELVSVPATFETVSETIVVQEQFVASDGTVTPAITETINRRVVKTPARTVERLIPSVSKTETRRVVKTPASTIERSVPYEKKDGKTRVPIKPASVTERSVAAVTKQVSRRVVKTPASVQERTTPAVTKEVQVRTLVPSKIYLRDEDGNVVREFESRDAFEHYKANLPTSVEDKPVSTFSVDVDTASYSFLRASINRGQLPPRSSIRLEEMINYFPYDYEAPKSADEPFKANVTVTSNPWDADKKLMHVGIKGYVPTQAEKPRSNLVFLIDTSGSMNQANKLPLLINSFKLLLNTLDEDDTVSIVAYASASGTVLEPTAVRNKSDILAALNNLRAGGSTAGAAGLELAYKNAEANFDDEGINRVILATDGDFNVGFSSPDDMKTFISEKRDTGIFLSVLGFGMGNYNDHLMQSLAQNGNGVAAYIDSLAEAQKVLANEGGSSLITIAKDVKIQVEFNPATIAEYRLIGYETRALKRQDFNNDKVDAGEIGAGHSVTAIYEMTPVGSPALTVDKLRYVAGTEAKYTGSDEYAFVKIRHKLPKAETSTLQTFPIGKSHETRLSRASDDMRFATAVAAVGQKLRGDVQVEDFSYEEAIKLASKAKGEDENGYRAEFIQMVRLIDGLGE